ncbi:type II secretion system F family protein [Candidatus Margulisiibacteriota bacterium]
MWSRSTSFSIEEQKHLFEQLYDLLDNGLPLKKSISLIAASRPKLKGCLQKIILHLQNGSLFSEAIGKEGKYFDTFLPFFIKFGEASGDLGKAVQDLLLYLNKKLMLIEQIKKQTFYPALILIATFFSGILMLQFLFPTMVTLFTESNLPIPRFLKLLIYLKGFLVYNYLFLLALLGFCLFLLIKNIGAISLSLFRRFTWLHTWIKMIFANQLFEHLALLTKVGLPLTESISMQKNQFKNSLFKDQIKHLLFQVKNGSPLSTALEKGLLLDDLYIQIIRTAENTGQLAQALAKIAKLLSRQLDENINRFLKWLEPLTTLILGAIVALFLLSIFYPLTKILGSL